MTASRFRPSYKAPPPLIGGYLDGSMIDAAPYPMSLSAFKTAYAQGERRSALLSSLLFYIQSVRRHGDETIFD